ncbi:MAG: hypothetical protein K2M82_05650 [Lachnospiraceae bacterium]|nr:hypothetical protein [Lachnospiraceae bacterium]
MHFLTDLSLKYQKLMNDRHGMDTLSRDAIFLWLIVGVVNTFIGSRVVMLVALLLPIFSILRMFSKETYKRSRENLKYMGFRAKAVDFFKMQYRKVRDVKTHRYFKCRNCCSHIRVKRIKGKHTVCCPKCGKEFAVNIVF